MQGSEKQWVPLAVSVDCVYLEEGHLRPVLKTYCYSLFALHEADRLILFSRQACDTFWGIAAILIIFIQWWQISGR